MFRNRPNSLLLTVLFSISLGFGTAGAAEPKIEAYKAPFHVGQSVMACGKIAEVKDGTKSVFMNFDYPYPKQTLTILIWNNNLNKFKDRFGDLKQLLGKRVCARGEIIDHKSRLEIILTNPQFLRLMQ